MKMAMASTVKDITYAPVLVTIKTCGTCAGMESQGSKECLGTNKRESGGRAFLLKREN